MALKKIKPTTPGQRHKVVVTNDDITAAKPEKSLVFGARNSGGRNNTGKMTMRYIGGGHKNSIVLSISNAKKTVFLLWLKPLNTTLIVVPVSHWYFTPMAKNATYSLLKDSKLVKPLCRVQASLLKWAIPLPSPKFLSVPSSTTLNSVPVREPKWFVPPALMLN